MSANRLSTLASVARILMLAKADDISPLVAAEKIFGPAGRAAFEALYTKAPVASTGRDGPLYSAAGAISAAFADSLRAASVVGRLATTPTPFGIFPFISARTRGAFVAERAVIPVSASSIEIVALDRLKIAALVVVTNELLNHSQAETILDRELRAGLVEGADFALLDGAPGVAEERPASVLYGATAVDASGAATAEDFDGVLNDLLAAAAGANLATCAFVGSLSIALALSQLRKGDERAFPNLSALGGQIAGLPLLVSESAPAAQLALIDGREVLLAQDAGVELSTSEHALIDQSSAPAGTTRVSMFQTESTALRAVWRINWKLRRPFAAYATNFAPPTSSYTGSP
jgi:HK97 family phage major capsid protein